MKIDERTLVPVGWVLSGMFIVIASVISATFWISTVNNRLGRIEEKLGIKAADANTIMSEARAEGP
jgi:hypothetical protein